MITATAITTMMITAMTENTSLLTMLQWLSPAFPIGAFAYSHGLEWAIEAGHVKGVQSLQLWLEDLITLGSGRSDALLVALA